MFGPAWRLLFVRWLPLVVLCAHTAAGNVSPLKIDAAVDDLSTMVEDLEIYSEYHGVTHRRSLHKTALTAVETERVELNNKSGVAEATALKLPTLKNRAMVDTYAVRTPPPAADPAPLALVTLYVHLSSALAFPRCIRRRRARRMAARRAPASAWLADLPRPQPSTEPSTA